MDVKTFILPNFNTSKGTYMEGYINLFFRMHGFRILAGIFCVLVASFVTAISFLGNLLVGKSTVEVTL